MNVYLIKSSYSNLKIKNTTKTVKKPDQPYLNFKFDEDLPYKTQVLPLKIKKTTKTAKKHDQPCLNLKFDKDLPNNIQVLSPQNKNYDINC